MRGSKKLPQRIKENIMATDTLTISDTIKVVRVDETPNSDIYAEVMHGFETGNYFEVPAAALPAVVMEAYATQV